MGRERGANVIDVPNNREMITAAINKQILKGKFNPEKRFGDGNSGGAIAEILATVSPLIQKKMTY